MVRANEIFAGDVLIRNWKAVQVPGQKKQLTNG